MKTVPILYRLLGGLTLCLLFVSCDETEQKRRTVGYKGEARSNGFLATQRMLANQGRDVISQNSVGDLDYFTSTIFLSPSSLNTVGRTKRIIDWVDNGGHLIVMLSSGEKRGNDFRMEEEYSS